jgi:ABC-type sugar transport system substrate-binding protein
MASFCPQVKIVAEPGLNTNDLVGDTKAKVQALLRQYPKGKLDWIWVADSTLAIPAAQALQAAGRDKDVFITGHNGILQEFDYIRAGGPCKACTYNSVEYYTAVAMQTMANLFRGVQPIAHTIYCSTPFINKRNVPPKGKYPPTPYVLASSNTKI